MLVTVGHTATAPAWVLDLKRYKFKGASHGDPDTLDSVPVYSTVYLSTKEAFKKSECLYERGDLQALCALRASSV